MGELITYYFPEVYKTKEKFNYGQIVYIKDDKGREYHRDVKESIYYPTFFLRIERTDIRELVVPIDIVAVEFTYPVELDRIDIYGFDSVWFSLPKGSHVKGLNEYLNSDMGVGFVFYDPEQEPGGGISAPLMHIFTIE